MPDRVNFQPYWCSPPGATIADILSERAISIADFADLIGESSARVSDLIAGETEIDDQLAASLSDVIGASQSFWMRREKQYRSAKAHLAKNDAIESPTEWLTRLPIADMKKFGWIPNLRSHDALFDACLKYFNVPNLTAWEVAYRPTLRASAYRLSRSYVTDPVAIVTWLRMAEKSACETVVGNWNPSNFRASLSTIRRLSLIRDPRRFLPKLREICASCGVSLVIVPTPTGCPASGATRFLKEGNAMMVLSFRYKTDDQFWFTFFHEAGHLLLHSNRELFLEDGSEITQCEEEEANDFAASILIPPEHLEYLSEIKKDSRSVIRFAVSIGLSPGIVVGQMQHRNLIRFNQLNFLKRRYSWAVITG